MKCMLLAAATVLSLGAGSAFANESDGPANGYVYPGYQFPTQQAPSAATAPMDQTIHNYVTHSDRGTWLFPPNQNQGGNS